MEQRRGCTLCPEVVGRLEREPQVRRIERGGDAVGRDVGDAEGRQDDRRDGDRDEQADRGGGQQASGAPRVEGGQRDRPRPLELADQETRDEKPREDEEDVDPDVAARQSGDAGVVDEDEEDGDAAEALEVGAEPVGAWLSRSDAGGRVIGRRRCVPVRGRSPQSSGTGG
jgi:hypothetical protein